MKGFFGKKKKKKTELVRIAMQIKSELKVENLILSFF